MTRKIVCRIFTSLAYLAVVYIVIGAATFLAAPLGEKYCHYEREVSTLRWEISTTGNPIASWDEGKTWTVFTPDAGTTVPKYDTVQQVYISWKKTEE